MHKLYVETYADVAELADAPDLGSGVPDVQVQVLSPAFNFNPTIDYSPTVRDCDFDTKIAVFFYFLSVGILPCHRNPSQS